MKGESTLTVEAVTARISYDPETGNFTRIVAAGGRKAGEVCGCLNAEGYIQIDILGVKTLAHRLAWFVMTGAWPENDIDHWDTVRHHNWFANLRPATRGQNMQNLRSAHCDSRTGLLGVTPSANGQRYVAQLRRPNGGSHYIGTFDTPQAAHAAYVEAKVRHHEFQTIERENV